MISLRIAGEAPGEVSVLDQMTDTSYGASAPSTERGVWMSITPGDDALVVTLDIQGTHPIYYSVV